MAIILQTVLILGIISAVLALALSLADKYIADYGEVELKINDEDPMVVAGGNSLLSTLRDNKIFIPSACGGKGSCGYCKCQVLEGGGPVLATELPWLTKEEVESNTRLSCQVKVKQDIKIQIPEELFNVREYDVTVESIEDVTDKIKKIRWKLPEGESITFKPGQYIQIKAPEYDGCDEYDGSDEEVYRAYSIASSARDHGYIDNFIGYTKGICSTYVHKVMKVGDTVNINGPYGDFYYKEDDGGPILLIGAGTGMAPLLSILYHLRDNQIDRKVRMFFGARTPDDLFVLDEMKHFEEEIPDFKFMPTLSRTTPEMNWTGDTGRVTDSIDKYVEDGGGNWTAYLCGSPRMIDSIIEHLTAKGVTEDRIYYDAF